MVQYKVAAALIVATIIILISNTGLRISALGLCGEAHMG